MWMMCESDSKDDCDILFLYHGNLFFDEVEEIDGGEPEKEDEWVLLSRRITIMRKKIWH